MKHPILVGRAIVPHPLGIHNGVLVVKGSKGNKFNLPGGKAQVHAVKLERKGKDGQVKPVYRMRAEKPAETTSRELFEETRIQANKMRPVHRMTFAKSTKHGREHIHQVVFEVTHSQGVPIKGHEVRKLDYYVGGKQKIKLTHHSQTALKHFLKNKK